jgi:hypothetical protein
MTNKWPRVHIVEDQASALRTLHEALLRAGIKNSEIEQSSTYDDAWTKFEQFLSEAKRRADRRRRRLLQENGANPSPGDTPSDCLPVVMIADIGLKHEVENGIALLGNVFRATAEHLKMGLWTVAVTAHPLDRIGQERPHIPHILLQKDISGRTWPRLCSSVVSPLIRPQIATDTPGNDLAPTRKIPPFERIYLYERGDAMYANLNLDGPQFQECFDLGLIQPKLAEFREATCPVLMYRGRYIMLNQHSFGKLARVLLRARTVMQAKRQDSFAGELMSFDAGGNLEDQASGNGIPAVSIGNFITWLRGTKEIPSLIEHIIDLPLNTCLPPVAKPEGWSAPRRVLSFENPRPRMDPGWLQGPVLRCPPDLGDPEHKTDGFFSRLQFVLSEQEINNYRHWKEKWLQYSQAWKGAADGR